MEISGSSRRVLAGLLESRTGQQLAASRNWRVDAALAPIVRDGGFDNIDQLVSRIASGSAPALAEQVIEALLNNETYFYRDKLPFDLLMAGPLKRLEAARAAEKKLAIWSVGCSTGQELYSLAMSLAEQGLRWRGWTIELVGTDISRSAIERARSGFYSQFEVQRGLPVLQMVRCSARRAAANGASPTRSATWSGSRFGASPTGRRSRASSTSSCAATFCSISRTICDGSPSRGLRIRSRRTDR